VTRRPRWLCSAIARLDYGLLLPLLSRLPPWAAGWFIRLRGVVNYAFDLEWRTLALGHGYVREATLLAMRAICSLTHSPRSPHLLTLRRFVTSSWEEYDAQRLARIDYAGLPWHGCGMDKVLQAVRSGRGVVLLTGHFDSLYVGLMVLARQGIRVNLMSSRIVEDPRAPKEIRAHFANKIAVMAKHFHPGKVMHFEDGLKPFADALKRGEIVVVACDGPATAGNRGTVVRFLGANYEMAAGPEFFARKAAALVSMYTCVREADGRFRLDFSEPAACEDGGMQLAFDRLDERIRAEPWRWWAADLYRGYATAKTEPAVRGNVPDAVEPSSVAAPHL